MRVFCNLCFLVLASTAIALDDNRLETWVSPNRRYAVKETFYGEGYRVLGVFVNLATGGTATIYPPPSSDPGAGNSYRGTRSIAAIWSPDSHYVALSTDRSKYCGDACLYRVEHGKISEIELPPNMEAENFLSKHAKKHFGHLSFHDIQAARWLNNSQVEFVSETEAVPLDDTGNESVEQHFIIEISRGKAKIIKSYGKKGLSDD